MKLATAAPLHKAQLPTRYSLLTPPRTRGPRLSLHRHSGSALPPLSPSALSPSARQPRTCDAPDSLARARS
eukprot:7287782-Prymnesium_polylepis.1